MNPNPEARVAVLISGRGSNMVALADAEVGRTLRLVVSNIENAEGLTHAQSRGLPTRVVPHKNYSSREDFERALMATLDEYSPTLVVLGGFMRVLTPLFINHYLGRLINIHPSLLPSFAGLSTHERALTQGVRMHGCTVHFVNAEVDGGAMIAQAAVPVLPDDSVDTLAKRVLAMEHQLLPRVVGAFNRHEFSLQQGRVHWENKHAWSALAEHNLMVWPT